MNKLFFLSFLFDVMLGIFSNCSTIALLKSGFPIANVAIAFGILSLSTGLLEIPTGVFADKKGRKYSTILGLFICAISYFLFASENMVAIYTAMIALGFGSTLISGAKDAWLVNRSLDLNQHLNHERLQLKLSFLGRLGIIVGTWVGILSLYVSPSFMWLVLGTFTIITIILAMFSKAGSADESASSEVINFSHAVIHLKKTPVLICFLGAALFFGLEQGVRDIVAQPYMLDLTNDELYKYAAMNNVFALFRMAGILFYRYGFSTKGKGIVFVSMSFITFAVVELLIGLTSNVTFFVVLYGLGLFTFGWQFPLRASYLNQYSPENLRATILSTDSMLYTLASSLTSFWVSSSIVRSELNHYWYICAGLCLVAGLSYFSSMLFLKRSAL